MKTKIPLYVICLALIAVPFYIAYLSPSPSFAANLASFLSVLAGFLILIIFGSKDGHAG